MIRFGPEICTDLDAACSREWLETNGLGGFASSTITGLNTRRYHGLLIAAPGPPFGRLVLLSKLEETLVIGDRRFELSANRYPGVVHPEGFRYLRQFRLDPFPVFTYVVEDVQISKSVFMVHGENTTVVRYEWEGDACLEIRPLIAFRDYHSTTHENSALDSRLRIEPGLAAVAPYQGLPALYFAHDGEAPKPAGSWYRNFEYDREQERGLDYQEDLFNPFVLKFSEGANLIASTERREAQQAGELREREIRRRQQLGEDALARAADQFIVATGGRKTVIAGYHWFTDWGRDTMIALPGLTLATARAQDAKDILLSFSGAVDQGMLPNRFPDTGETPEYNTVDATLWFFEAIYKLLECTGDDAFVRENLYDVLVGIIDWHLRGTRYGIHVDTDGLLAAGEAGVQLTWMDARIGDWVVTPRQGKPVEIQALWYNALRIMQRLAGPGGERYASLAERVQSSFNRLFWNEAAGCLYDVIDEDAQDESIRPNQVLALSLSHTMISREQAVRILEVIRRELLTPYGLRSLSPRDPRYRGRYEGDQRSRDAAYHQGTVWPWLLGPFIAAWLNVNGSSAQAREQAAQWLTAFDQHLEEAGLGQISEIFDGDAPHHPRGCIAQAWSVAELLRARRATASWPQKNS